MMHTTPETSFANPPETTPFMDRRAGQGMSVSGERRQFASSHNGLSADARELALAIDGYKLENRRRFITFEEMLHVIQQLGYSKAPAEKDA